MSQLIPLFSLLFLSPPASSQPLTEQIDTLFADWNHPNKPGAAVAVVHNDTVLYMKGHGSANLEYGTEVTPETVFLVASVSKQFTAFAIAMLIARGDISLDDDIRTYVPEMHAFEPPIMIHHLVHHTSGLRDEFGLLGMAGYHMDDVISKDKILDLLYRQRMLNFEPGEEYSYSNSGYTLMAEIVERVTGKAFGEWTTDNIFAPLGMTNSHFREDHSSVIPNRAQGYITDDSTFKNQNLSYSSVGASGLYTTVEDLARWMENFKTGEVGGPDVLSLIQQRGVLNSGDTLAYAFGLIHDTYKAEQRIGHSGSHRGFKTYATRFPDLDLAIIVLGNLEEFQPATIAQQIADLFLPDDAERLADYVGIYHSDELSTSYEVVLEDPGLVLVNRRGGGKIPLNDIGSDAFVSDAWYMAHIQFKRSEELVSSFEASNRRTRNVVFSRQ